MKTMFIVLFAFFSFNISFCQEVITKELNVVYTFIPEGKLNKIIFTSLIPNDLSGIQKVKAINYSIEPDSVFTVKENKYAKFIIEHVKQEFELTINYTIDLYKRDLKVAKAQPLYQHDGLDSFMVEEKFIEISDLNVKNKSKDLLVSDTLKTVKNIYTYLSNNFSYSGFNKSDVGAAMALQKRDGDCTEFTDLFVALCRANGIPAKVVEGYTTEFANTPLHSWPEVYLHKYGWIRFDPTTNNAISYSQLYNKYIQLSSVRNDKVLDNHHRWYYKYWGDNIAVYEHVRIIN